MSAPTDGQSPSVGEPSGAPRSQTDTSRDADVHAFLLADVRGYTAFTRERGDEEAARLAGRFAQVTRSVVEDHRGNVLELRGDEALVVFGSPRSAIRGAVALQQRFVEETIADPSLPLTVGIGLDAGEAVAVEGGYRGGALNVAARLCSLARAGEVLASREIVHLSLRVDGVRFTERGEAALKGLDKPVHVVAVRSEERDDALAIAPFVRSIARPPRTRWKAVAAVVAFAVVATLVAIPLVTRDPGGDPGIEPNSIGVLDPESGDVTATVELEDRPGSVVASADAVWVTNPDIGTVTRIDPDEQEVRDRIQVGENPTGIAVGFDAVWVLESGEPSVSRISPDTNTVVDRIGVGNGPVDIAVGEGGVWVSNRFDGTISRIDPDAGKVVKTIPVGLDPGGIAIGFGSVWVGLAGANTVVRVDPQTNEVKQSILVNAPGALAVGADAIWVVNTLVDTTSSIDPEAGRVASVLEVGDGPADITVLDGTVWVANEGDGTLSRIAADAASAHRVVIGSVPQGLAGVNGDLWISVRGTVTSHRGGTLRLVSKEGPQTFDSTIAYDFISWRVSHVIGDGLLASKLVGGAEGWTLVPDLAISLPSQTDGGRTYAFQVRPGIRYSNGELVVPGDFRRAIERGFRVDNDYIRLVYRGLFRGLIGSQACTEEPATCDLSRGIVTDDEAGTVTFHLVAPDSELPFKLTMPFAYPVPSSVPLEEQARSGTPGTGPYMLEAPMTDDGLVLVRNPYFRSWSAAAQPGGYVDRIEWTFGIEPEAQIVAVAEGRADLAYDADQYRRLGETLVRFPAQVYTSPFATTFFVVLNTQVPPFDDVRVRRAINFALDRDRVVQIFGGERAALPTCQQLPPNFPGYEPYCPYTLDPGEAGTWSAPDMDEARRLVHRSGTMGTRIAFEYPRLLWGSDGAALGNYLVKLLEELGYRARVKTAAVGPFYQPGHEFQMGLDAWGLDYPAASNFIANRFKCEASLPPSSEFCDPEIDTMIERATRVQTGDQAAASKLWSGIDRQIVDQAPFVWLANPITVNFVSVRVGNYQWSPVWEVLLTQIWVL